MSTTPDAAAVMPAQRSNGLATYFKVLLAPGDAFATLARVPTWGWAAIAGMILMAVASLILSPANVHFSHIAQAQRLAQMPADQAAAARQAMARIPDSVYVIFGVVGALVVSWLIWLVSAVVFIIAASLSGAEARFLGAWVIAVNIYVIGLVGAIVNSVIVMLRGVASVTTAADLYALPSLAMVIHSSPKLAVFLYTFNIINIWLYIVTIIALERVLKMSSGAAIVTVLVLALITAGLGSLFVK
jgi:hypothetical protein